MTTRRPARAKAARKRERIGKTPYDPNRPIGKSNPPIETQFTAGNRASVGKGRPRKLAEFQELIRDTLAEEVIDQQGRSLKLTRAQAAIRVMFGKGGAGAIALFEYAFGKVPATVNVIDGRARIVQLLRAGAVTPEDVIAELGVDLATELFESAGVAVTQGVEVGAAGGGEAEINNPPDPA